MLYKKYKIRVPVQVDFEDNNMSPQATSIVVNVDAKSVEDATNKVSKMLETLIRDNFGGKT